MESEAGAICAAAGGLIADYVLHFNMTCAAGADTGWARSFFACGSKEATIFIRLILRLRRKIKRM
jgi:hypothetical protein